MVADIEERPPPKGWRTRPDTSPIFGLFAESVPHVLTENPHAQPGRLRQGLADLGRRPFPYLLVVLVLRVGYFSDYLENRRSTHAVGELDRPSRGFQRLRPNGRIGIRKPLLPVHRVVDVVDRKARLLLGLARFPEIEPVGGEQRDAVEANLLGKLELFQKGHLAPDHRDLDGLVDPSGERPGRFRPGKQPRGQHGPGGRQTETASIQWRPHDRELLPLSRSDAKNQPTFLHAMLTGPAGRINRLSLRLRQIASATSCQPGGRKSTIEATQETPPTLPARFTTEAPP